MFEGQDLLEEELEEEDIQGLVSALLGSDSEEG